MEQIHKTFLDLGWKYIGCYEKGTFKMEMLNTMPSVRKVVLTIYYGLVAKKKITPIEGLDQDQKMALWELCKDFCTGLTTDQRRDFARCYHCLDELIKLKIE